MQYYICIIIDNINIFIYNVIKLRGSAAQIQPRPRKDRARAADQDGTTKGAKQNDTGTRTRDHPQHIRPRRGRNRLLHHPRRKTVIFWVFRGEDEDDYREHVVAES